MKRGCRNDLLKNGIAADHMKCYNMISMRYTSENFDDGMTDKGRYCLLLDEIQEIEGWEKAANSLLENANTDIYVTGSNSRFGGETIL